MPYYWFAVFSSVFVWSAINPHDYFTWVLEVLPAVIGALVVAVSFKRFKLTALLYWLILLHCVVLMVGGHYTYALVPGFDEFFGSTRNNYDKLGHFFQGFVPAIIARELLLKQQVLAKPIWLSFIVVIFVLALSAFYELLEWLVAIIVGSDSESFLGTQGYVWDTQTDMAMALLGAVLALVLLSHWHNRQLHQQKILYKQTENA